MPTLEPRRMTGSVLRTVARAGRAPLLGKGLRSASLGMMGVAQLRDARLGDVRPWVPQQDAAHLQEGRS